jgi:hypothetical protein
MLDNLICCITGKQAFNAARLLLFTFGVSSARRNGLCIFAAMKWLVYLFSLYILLLTAVPCSGSSDCCSDVASEAPNSEPSGAANDHKPVSACSPFFACGSCHAVVITENKIEWHNNSSVDQQVAKRNKSQLLFDYTPVIWQPPRCS